MAAIEIELEVWTGDLCQAFKLSQVQGTGDNAHFHIYYVSGHNQYWYRGAMFKHNGAWEGPDDLTADDLMVLGELIDNAMAGQNPNDVWT